MIERKQYHNKVALRLEKLGNLIIGPSFYTADEISQGQFADAVMSIVQIGFNDPSIIKEYACKCVSFDKKLFSGLEDCEIQTQKEIVDELWDQYKAQQGELS